ncbi:ThiF family adenylyltransferase, partial [Escherichia coli]
FEDAINSDKNMALLNSLKKISPDINIDIINDIIDDDFFKRNILPSDIDLIINCADEPNVDYTSKIIAL